MLYRYMYGRILNLSKNFPKIKSIIICIAIDGKFDNFFRNVIIFLKKLIWLILKRLNFDSLILKRNYHLKFKYLFFI